MVIKSDSKPIGRKDGRIKDFFKAFAAKPAPAPVPAPASPKRPREEVAPQGPADMNGRRSKSPRIAPGPNAKPLTHQTTSSASPAFPNMPSSDLSSLSSVTPMGSDSAMDDVRLTAPGPSAAPDARPTSSDRPGSSSFYSSSRSSQRVTRHGEDMVLDSSDDDGDEVSSLDDLGELLGRPSPPANVAPASLPDPPRQRRSERTRGSDRSGRALRRSAKPSRTARSLPAVPQYKNSLAALVARAKAAEAEESAYRNALGLVAEADRSAQAAVAAAGDLGRLDGNALAPMMDGRDREDVDRLLRAVERTEALRVQTSWSYFRPGGPVRPFLPPFPELDDAEPLQPLLKDRRGRELAIASGYVAEVAARQPLPPALLSWFVAAAVAEEREDLRAAALRVVHESGAALTDVVTQAVVCELLEGIGASIETLEERKVLQPVTSMAAEGGQSRDWDPLHQVLQILTSAAPWMQDCARNYALFLLLPLCADTALATAPLIPLALEDVLVALMDAFPDPGADTTLRNALEGTRCQVADAQLRLQILRALPCTTVRACIARRRFASCCFFEDPAKDDDDDDADADELDLPAITKHLRTSPTFGVGSQTDYPTLTARVATLDIMLGDGRPLPSDEVEHEDDQDRGWARRFDAQVDALADAVKALAARIVDTGASHMARTEAKEALQALHARLAYGVRTRPKPRKSIFAGEDEAEERRDGAERMQRFLKGHGGRKGVKEEGEDREREAT